MEDDHESSPADKEMQQKYMEYQMLEAQGKQIEKQLKQVDAQAEEIASIAECIDEISKPEASKKLFIPVSSGVYIQGEISDSETFLVNVGSNVLVKKTAFETKELIVKQKGELDRAKAQIMEEFAKVQSRMLVIERELMAYATEASAESE